MVAMESYEYDEVGNTIKTTFADGRITSALFDERGYLWKWYKATGTASETMDELRYFDSGTIKEYDSPHDGSVITTVFTLDKFDYPHSSEVVGYGKNTFDYDEIGRVSASKYYGYVGGSYQLIEQTLKTRAEWHDKPTFTARTIYDATGTTVQRVVTNGSDYGPSGLPLTLKINSSVIATFEYDDLGRPLLITAPDGS